MGDYSVHITPDSMRDCIIAHAPIVDEGHIIIGTKIETIIRDVAGQYELRFPKDPDAKEWTLPVDILQRLTRYRRNYPLAAEDHATMLQPLSFDRMRDISATPNTGLDRPPLTYIRSARLQRPPKAARDRVIRVHERRGHVPEDNMVAAITTQPGYDHPLWENSGITPPEVRAVFNSEPCLICVLAKRRKEGMCQWIKKARKKHKSKLIVKSATQEEIEAIRAQLAADQKTWKIGELIYCDDVPVHPISLEGFWYFFVFRDTKSRKIMTFCTKSNDDTTYLRCLRSVIRFFDRIYAKRASELGPRPPTIVRTDRFKAFDSADCKAFYEENHCSHEQASAYRHHQVAAERDIQTIVQNVAACVHTNDFIRATSLARAVDHWTALHGDTPLSETPTNTLTRIDEWTWT